MRTAITTLLKLPSEMFDTWVTDESDSFPQFQVENRADSSRELSVDFSECEWASPLPLLAIAVEIASRSVTGRAIKLNLGVSGGTTKAARNVARTRRFLLVHGFIAAFAVRAGDLNVSIQLDADDSAHGYGGTGHWIHARTATALVEQVTPLLSASDLLFGNECVIPATLLKVGHSEGQLPRPTLEKIRKLMEGADNVLFKHRTADRQNRDTTLQRLNQTILELVQNASEHAYTRADGSVQGGWVGIYSRVVPIATSDEGHAALTKSNANSPSISLLLLGNRNRRVELYVVDVGSGLLGHASRWKPQEGFKTASKARTLHAVAQHLFEQPLSRHDRSDPIVKEARGTTTGLMHLHKVWAHRRDGSRIVSGKEWVCGPHPRPPGWNSKAKFAGGYEAHKGRFQGTIVHCLVSASTPPPLPKSSHWFDSTAEESKLVREQLISSFLTTDNDLSLENLVVDIRDKDSMSDVASRVSNVAGTHRETIVRMHRIVEKNVLVQVVDRWFKASLAAQSIPAKLLLCDLGRYQALDTEWILQEACKLEFQDISAENLKHYGVFVVTEDLCVAKYVLSITAERKFALNKAPLPDSEICIAVGQVLTALRKCDSRAVWQSIRTLSKQDSAVPILIENVVWAEDPKYILPFYLNFSALIHDQEVSRHLRRSLRRVLALFPDAQDEAIDRLVESPLHDAKKWLRSSPSSSENRVLVGSLSISGHTLNRHSKALQSQIRGVVDCFATPYYDRSQSKVPHLAALLWDPGLLKPTAAQPAYRRYALSPHVAPIHFASLPTALTANSDALYRDAASNHLLKIGHWTYGDRHSLMEINVEAIVEQSSAAEHGAIKWLVEKIQRLRLTHDVHVAYPMHRVSYRLMRHVYKRCNDNNPTTKPLKGVSTLDSKPLVLLPLEFLGRWAGGMSYLTPLSIEACRKSIRMRVNRQGTAIDVAARPLVALIVDTGFITNRTHRHLTRQLREIGYEDIRSTGLINRSSFPAFESEAKSFDEATGSLDTFWRWHVPTLGTTGHCAICSARAVLVRLRPILEQSRVDLLPALDAIADAWGAADLADYWFEKGLEPQTINPSLEKELRELDVNERTAILASSQSTALIGRMIEQMRLGTPLGRLRRRIDLVCTLDSACAVEMLSSFLLLLGSSINGPDRTDLVRKLLVAAFALSRDTATKRQIRDDESFNRRARLLNGLAAIVFAGQDSVCKSETLPLVVTMLAGEVVTDTTLRVALVSLTTESDAGEHLQGELAALVMNFDSAARRVLRQNYDGIRTARLTQSQSWSQLIQLVGRAENHGPKSMLGNLLAALESGKSRDAATPILRTMFARIAMCDAFFLSDCLGIDAKSVNAQLEVLTKFVDAPTTSPGAAIEAVRRVWVPVATAVYGTLVRFGQNSDHKFIYTTFDDVLARGAENHLWEIESGSGELRWPVSGLLPLCNQVVAEIRAIFDNIEGYGQPFPPLRTETSPGVACYVSFLVSPPGKTVTIRFRNLLKPTVGGDPLDVVRAPHLLGLGFRINGHRQDGPSGTEYVTDFLIPMLDKVLENDHGLH